MAAHLHVAVLRNVLVFNIFLDYAFPRCAKSFMIILETDAVLNDT